MMMKRLLAAALLLPLVGCSAPSNPKPVDRDEVACRAFVEIWGLTDGDQRLVTSALDGLDQAPADELLADHAKAMSRLYYRPREAWIMRADGFADRCLTLAADRRWKGWKVNS